jgi:hypothetical protein
MVVLRVVKLKEQLHTPGGSEGARALDERAFISYKEQNEDSPF